MYRSHDAAGPFMSTDHTPFLPATQLRSRVMLRNLRSIPHTGENPAGACGSVRASRWKARPNQQSSEVALGTWEPTGLSRRAARRLATCTVKERNECKPQARRSRCRISAVSGSRAISPLIGELPFTRTATDSGTAVGAVHTDLLQAQGDGYAAHRPTWKWVDTFAGREGTMEINWNFDQEHVRASNGLKNFEGKMCAPRRVTASLAPSRQAGRHIQGQSFRRPSEPKGSAGPQRTAASEGARDINGFASRLLVARDSYDNGNPRPARRSKASSRRDGKLEGCRTPLQASGGYAASDWRVRR